MCVGHDQETAVDCSRCRHSQKMKCKLFIDVRLYDLFDIPFVLFKILPAQKTYCGNNCKKMNVNIVQ